VHVLQKQEKPFRCPNCLAQWQRCYSCNAMGDSDLNHPFSQDTVARYSALFWPELHAMPPPLPLPVWTLCWQFYVLGSMEEQLQGCGDCDLDGPFSRDTMARYPAHIFARVAVNVEGILYVFLLDRHYEESNTSFQG